MRHMIIGLQNYRKTLEHRQLNKALEALINKDARSFGFNTEKEMRQKGR